MIKYAGKLLLFSWFELYFAPHYHITQDLVLKKTIFYKNFFLNSSFQKGFKLNSIEIAERDGMLRKFKLCGILILVFFISLWQCRTGEAFHSGGAEECQECHVGTGGQLRGSDTSSSCLRCHQASAGTLKPTGYYVATNIINLSAGMPPSQLTPGGDFGYLKKNYYWSSPGGGQNKSVGERHGHNIVAMDFGYVADTINILAPGGNYPANELSCISCHDPHGKIAKDPTTNGAYRLLGGVGYSPRSAGGITFTFDSPVAVAPPNYNRSEAVTDTRVAYGKGMSEWCANCHAKIGADAGAAQYGHPVGSLAKFSQETISTYNAYLKSGNLSGSGNTSYTSLVPFEEGTENRQLLAQHARSDGGYTNGPDFASNVMCLTCHRAHASGWDLMARWNMSTDFIIYDSVCPGTDKNSPKECAQGRTSIETQRALYDRPPSLYASYQRGLCNKCHTID